MKRSTRSLLEELNSIVEHQNSKAVIESRATHIINSAINLISLIKENFSEEQADELERRLINSIKGNDPNKFIRGIRKIQENKKTTKSKNVSNKN